MEKEIDEIKNISAHILCICNLICVMGISNCGCVGWANSTLVVCGTTGNNKTLLYQLIIELLFSTVTEQMNWVKISPENHWCY